MNVDLPPIDAATFWGTITTIVSAPIYWVYRKIKHLESSFVSKEEFAKGMTSLEESNSIKTESIRSDILRLETTTNLVLKHLLERK